MSDLPEHSMSAVNRRITWLILVFVFLSLSSSVLPLISGIGELLPLPLVDRDSALGLHTLVLMAYMAFVFPLSILAPEPGLDPAARRRWDLGWWWVGGFILTFSGLPLFVLAYIAGVGLKAVLAVLAWAGVFHGLALLWPRLFGYRSRAVLVLLNFLLAVPVTAISYFGPRLGVEVAWWSPFAEVRAMTLEFAEPRLVLPFAVLAAVTIILWLPARVFSRLAASAAVLLLGVVLSAAGQTEGSASLRVVTGEFFVQGRPVSLELRAKPGERIVVDVAGRETLTWEPGVGEPDLRHYHASILQAGERIVARDRSGQLLLDQGFKFLAPDRFLALVVGESSALLPESVEVRRIRPEELDRSAVGLSAFSALVLGDGVEARLERDQRRALEDYVAEGGVAISARGQSGHEPGVFGRGRFLEHEPGAWVEGFDLVRRDLPAAEANLYSSFALPDWGRVDLRGLTAFLGLYHLIFYLTFLLPLLLDAKKSLGVYLVSVAFVLAVVVAGAYFVLKRVFLTENQILQQNVAVFAMTDLAGEQPLLLDQAVCFASFNGRAEELAFELGEEPLLIYPARARGPGAISFSGTKLRLDALEVDRRREKQMLRLRARAESPFALVPKQDGAFELRPRPGVLDRFELNSARILGAFLLRDGRLHEVKVEGHDLFPVAEPAALRWHEVLMADLRAEVTPFLAQALGRSAPEMGNVLGVLLSGAKLLHGEESYLQSRDVLQVLFIPVP